MQRLPLEVVVGAEGFEGAQFGIGELYQSRGEAPKAFVKLKQGRTATADDILAHLKPKISKIEMPEEIEFRDELPKTMVGKLSKKELRERAD